MAQDSTRNPNPGAQQSQGTTRDPDRDHADRTAHGDFEHVSAVGAAQALRDHQADPIEHNDYWSRNFTSRPYVAAGSAYERYQPAYQYGWESRSRFAGRSFEESEADLQSGWLHRDRAVEWRHAREAVKDAWQRVDALKAPRPDSANPNIPVGVMSQGSGSTNMETSGSQSTSPTEQPARERSLRPEAP